MARTTAALGAAVVLLSGCTGVPEVGLPMDAEAPVCARADWPQRVADAPRVSTRPQAPAVAAWGSPAIIARCGLPALQPTTDDCVSVNGVDWVVRQLDDGTAATTYGRDPAIEVLVPAQYGPVPLLLPLFGDVARTLPTNGHACVGADEGSAQPGATLQRE